MNFKYRRNKPEATVMEITPDIAQEMLATSPGNRTLRNWYVNLLAAAMKRGEWRVTSQGIGFDINGHLRDAHHRLHACIRADTSFLSVIVMGMPVNAYEVTDTGMIRSYADRLNMNRNVSEVLRLACVMALNNTRPTLDEMRPIINAGLADAAESLNKFCTSRRKYYSSAPVRLAACVTILNGGNPDFVMQQFRAMNTLDYESMTKCTQSLARQVDSGKLWAGNSPDTLARALVVFDEARKDITKIQISDASIDASVEFVRSVLNQSVELDQSRKPARRPVAFTLSQPSVAI
jgi:hypothetical protein